MGFWLSSWASRWGTPSSTLSVRICKTEWSLLEFKFMSQHMTTGTCKHGQILSSRAFWFQSFLDSLRALCQGSCLTDQPLQAGLLWSSVGQCWIPVKLMNCALALLVSKTFVNAKAHLSFFCQHVMRPSGWHTSSPDCKALAADVEQVFLDGEAPYNCNSPPNNQHWSTPGVTLLASILCAAGLI